jgi:predicted phage baseplate assembly protein
MDYGPLDAVYTVEDDGDGNISIKFGDGVSGAIPPIHAEIKCNYVVGGGTIGNVPTATLRKLEYIAGLTPEQVSALQSTLQITNPSPASGGTDPESSATIRTLAPLALRSLNRAVTLEDFASIATNVPGIGKAQARATTPQSVTVYIAPSRNDFDTDPTPGVNEVGDPTFEWESLKDLADAEFATKALIGTTTTVLPPAYTPVVVTIEATALPTYGNAEVEKNLKLTLLNAFGYNYVSFKDTLTREGIEYVLQQSPGIRVARVTGLTRFGSEDENPTLSPLVGDYDEIFRFYESNLTISVTGGAY